MGPIRQKSLDVPYESSVIDSKGILSISWQNFFRNLFDRIFPLGIETSFALLNNQSSAANIEGLQFDYRKVNQATIEYLIQRITTGTGATEIITTGMFMVTYKPVSQTWHIVNIGTPGPSASGITFSITTGGQVQYTSSNITGDENISKITYRARTLSAKVNL